MIKAIIFDWGGVLIKFPSDKTVRYWAKYLGVSPNKLTSFYEKNKKELWKGTLTQAKFFELVSEKFHCHKPKRKCLFEDSFDEAYSEQKKVFDIAKQIKEKGYRLALISNCEIPATKYFKKENYSIFDKIIISINEGTNKTEKKFYHLTLKRLNLKPKETILIDDKKYCINIAKEMEINTILFKNPNQLKREFKSRGIYLK